MIITKYHRFCFRKSKYIAESKANSKDYTKIIKNVYQITNLQTVNN